MEELTKNVLAISVTLNKVLENQETMRQDILDFRKEVDRKFDEVDKRFDEVDRKFEEVDKRFDEVDRKFEEVDKRFDEVDRKFEEVDRKFEEVDKRFEETDRKHNKLEFIVQDGFSTVLEVLKINTARLEKIEEVLNIVPEKKIKYN